MPAIVDYGCERNGAASMFLPFAPSESRRCVKAADRRAAGDRARFVRDLAGTHFADRKIVLAADSTDTRCTASPCAAFDPEKASRLRGRFEIR